MKNLIIILATFFVVEGHSARPPEGVMVGAGPGKTDVSVTGESTRGRVADDKRQRWVALAALAGTGAAAILSLAAFKKSKNYKDAMVAAVFGAGSTASSVMLVKALRQPVTPEGEARLIEDATNGGLLFVGGGLAALALNVLVS